MKINYEQMTKYFLLTEGQINPNIFSYVQALEEMIKTFRPSTIREKRNFEVAIEHLKEIKRHARKMSEDIKILEERIQLLEESSNKEE